MMNKKIIFFYSFIFFLIYMIALALVPNFCSLPMMFNILKSLTIAIILVEGMYYLILLRYYDFTISVVIGFTSYLIALFFYYRISLFFCVLAILSFILFVSLLNYLLICVFKWNTSFATILVSVFLQGAIYFIFGNHVDVYVIDHPFYWKYGQQIWDYFTLILFVLGILYSIYLIRSPKIVNKYKVLSQGRIVFKNLIGNPNPYYFWAFFSSSLGAAIIGIALTFMTGMGHYDMGNGVAMKLFFIIIMVGPLSFKEKQSPILFCLSSLSLFILEIILLENSGNLFYGKLTALILIALFILGVFLFRRLITQWPHLKGSHISVIKR